MPLPGPNRKPLRRSTPGLSKPTRSSPRPDPNPQQVAQMIAECVEIAPKIMYPLEVRTGARLVPEYDLPALPLAVIDLVNTEDEHEYTVMVTLKRPPATSRSSSSK